MLHLIQASAGAGKTHRLVHIYLQHILRSPTDIPNIVVLSFTNKATQELKERILTCLHDLVKKQESEMAIELQKTLGYDTSSFKKKAEEALIYLLNHYEKFAVYTIDTFFQILLRTLSYEVGLPSKYQLLLAEDQLLDSCTTMLLEQLPQMPELHKTLTELALQKIQEGKPWHFTQEIKRWGKDLVKTWQNRAEHIDITKESNTKELLKRIEREQNIFLQDLSNKAKTILYYLKEEQLEAKDFAWGEKGVIGFFKKLHQKKLSSPSIRIMQAGMDPTVWVTKKSPNREKILELVRNTLQPLAIEIFSYYMSNCMHHATSTTLLSLRHRLLTTQKLQALIDDYMLTHEILLIDSVPQHIKETIETNTTAFLYAKTGKKPQHFLIDESQDLSTAQWDGILPFIEQLLVQNKANYLVGDAKQAIYRWRGGNPQLLLSEVEREVDSSYIQKSQLSYNWRSKPAIVHFNNAFFSEAAELLENHLEREIPLDDHMEFKRLRAEVSHIRKAYAHVSQKIPPSKINSIRGYMNVSFIKPEQRGNAWKKCAIERTIATIEELQEAGYQCEEITLLVRNNIEAKTLLQALTQHATSDKAKPYLRYDAFAKAALSLTEDRHVALLIAALRLLHNPDDSVAFSTLQHADLINTFPSTDLKSMLSKKTTLYPLLLHLIHHFDIEKEASQAHLNAFKEIVHTFSLQKENSLSDFLTWWDKYGVQKIAPAPATTNAIQIMTIHQAKGLAFEIVILPFCDWRLDHSPYNPPMIWGYTHQRPFDKLINVPLTYSSKLKETFFSSSYIDEKWQQYLEQMNLLYVACTRARGICYLFAPYGLTKNITTTGNLLTHLLTTEKNPESLLHTQGKWDKNTLTWEAGVLPTCSRKMPSSSVQIMPRKNVSVEKNSHARLLARVTTQNKEGIWWHDLFSKLITPGDLPLLLNHYVKTKRLSIEKAEEIEALFKDLFQDQRLIDWYSNRWQVHTERTIMLPSGDLYRPDRVMTREQKAVVLDLKLGKSLPIHHEQVKHYLDMMTSLGYESVEGYLLSLTEKKLIQVQ